MLTHVSRCLCGIPVVHYVDDYGSINTKQDSQSSFQTFAQLNSILGFHMKPSKERRPASQHKIQGAIIQCQSDQITVTVKACPNRIQTGSTTSGEIALLCPESILSSPLRILGLPSEPVRLMLNAIDDGSGVEVLTLGCGVCRCEVLLSVLGTNQGE